MSTIANELVLVTGGSGFVGAYCILKCLEANYRVRTTVRSLDKKQYVLDMLKTGNAINLDKLTFVEADLEKEDGWSEAIKDCTFVLHVASPFPPGPPKHENDLIIPARDGTLRILREARDAKVKRVVITSSFAAIAYGDKNKNRSKLFTEEDWTDPNDRGVGAYEKSKTIAERAAWDFIEKEGGSLELAVVNPTSISGPVLGTHIALSVETVLRLMNGTIPGCPNLSFSIVDVRDVADLHFLAMTDPKAKGERFLAVAPPPMTIKEMSLALHEKMGNAARRAPTRQLPDFLLRLIAWFDPAVALVIPWLGESKPASNDKAKTLLGWKPRSNVDAIVASAESMIKLGMIKP